ncbi:hypothetical protein F183_A04970 [Bryobacterales bacterium F-183]|nr:hypothetical protein F183_A04970 [Bryobacterales bacterium F-183]
MRTAVLAAMLLEAAMAAEQQSKTMADGRVWTTANLNVAVPGSYCYDDQESNCAKYGRLYTWEAATQACRTALGEAWALPSNDEWRTLVKSYGPLREESVADSKKAFDALMTGGSSGFAAVLGGGRDVGADPKYARLDAHGFFWTATATEPKVAWFYNFGRNGQAVNRHEDGEKLRAFSVRCIRRK